MTTPKAIGATLNAGDVLEVRFTTTGPICPSGPCDALELSLNESGAFFDANVTADLFDGNTLLGSYFNIFCCVPRFRSPSSLFQAGGAVVDFTAIDSSTINGVIDVSIGTGFLTWPSAPTPDLVIGLALDPGVLLVGGTGLQVNSVTIIPAPEPWTLALLGIGLGSFLVGARLRQRPA